MQPAEPMPEETNCNHRQNDRDVRPRPKIAFSSQALKLLKKASGVKDKSRHSYPSEPKDSV